MTPICAVGAWIVLGLVFVLVTPAARARDVPTPPLYSKALMTAGQSP